MVDKLSERDIRPNKDGPLLGGYSLRAGGTRCRDAVDTYSLLMLDVDSKPSSTPYETVAPKLAKYEYVVYSTHRHDPTIGAYKYRFVFPLTRDIAPGELAPLHRVFENLLPRQLDEAGASVSQAFYLPSVSANAAHHAFYMHNRGYWLDPDEELATNAIADEVKGSEYYEVIGGDNILAFRLPVEVLDGQGRERTLLQYAGAMRAKNVAEAEILVACMRYNEEHIKPPLDAGIVADRVNRYAKSGEIDKRDDEALPRWLENLNARYAICPSEHLLYCIETRSPVTPAAFRLVNNNIRVPVAKKSGDTSTVDAATLWLADPLRRDIRGVLMRKGNAAITDDGYLNLWRGYAVTPVRGSVRPFFELIVRLIPDRKARHYFLRWICYVIQNPGSKVHTALVIWGNVHGSGKNLALETIGQVLPDAHFCVIGQSQLESEFNGWLADKVLVLGDEVSSLDRRTHTDRLKRWVTEKTLQVNEKGIPLRQATSTANFIFISNHADAVFLDDKDRRFFVHEVTAEAMTEAEADRFIQWRDHGGHKALLDFLLRVRTDRGVFNPYAPAPSTEAKRAMVEDSRSDLERWLSDLLVSDVVAVLGRVVVTATELSRAYRAGLGYGGQTPSPAAVSKALKRLRGGYQRPYQVRLTGGQKVRPIALGNFGYWKSAPESAWTKEMEKSLRHEVVLRTDG